MKMKKPPCGKCPYTLGLVKTLVNPCPQCKKLNYQTYEQFKKLTEGAVDEHRGR